MMNRREFTRAAVTLPFALRAMARGYVSEPLLVFLGTDKGKGIYRAQWNAQTGELGPIELAIEADRPDFFALSPGKKPVMYAVNSLGDGKGAVSAYRHDWVNGTLKLINKVSSYGDGPCAVSIDATGRAVYVANYTGGSFTGYGVAADGALLDPGGSFGCMGSEACGPLGPVKDRQDGAHIHCAVVSPHNDFVLACDLGDDAIEVFPIALGQKALYGGPTRVKARAGSGPRHVTFHPNGKWVYCIHELDCTIDLFDWRAVGKKPVMELREESVISTLAKGTGLKGNTGCEIVVSDDGKFVYACTRGVDQITVYRIGPTGLLTEIQRLSCGGQVPRYIAFDPSRKWLVSCNQGAAVNPVGSVTVFAHDAATGKLSEKPKTFASDTPMFVSWV